MSSSNETLQQILEVLTSIDHRLCCLESQSNEIAGSIDKTSVMSPSFEQVARLIKSSAESSSSISS